MDAFEEIYALYGRELYLFLLSLSKNEAVAEDLTQETLLRAVMNIKTFRGDCRLSVWLCQIGRNLYFDWLRRHRREVLGDPPDASGDAGGDPAEALENRDTAERILRCLHSLDEPYKEVFTLHALGEVPLAQVSRLFGKSGSWARVTYYRAKAMILSKLEEDKT